MESGYGGARLAAETLAQDQKRLTERSTDKLEDRIEYLALVNKAMWDLLSERLGVTDEELLAKINEIDGEDGQQDRRYTPTPQSCRCGAKLNPESKICIYCERKVAQTKIF